MSNEIPHAAVRSTLALLTLVAALPGMVWAAQSKAPPNPNVSALEGSAAARPATPPARGLSAQSTVRTPASFTPHMPLDEAIDILRNCTTPPLNIVVLWRSLDGAGIYKDTPIGIDGLAGLRVGQYLDLLVLSLSAGASEEIAYTVRGGVITIGTRWVLPASRQMTRVYDIRDLTAPPSNPSLAPMGFGGMGYGGMYGNQMMGLSGGYGGGLGAGYGMGSGYMPGGYNGLTGSAGRPNGIGSLYGGTRTRSVPRGR